MCRGVVVLLLLTLRGKKKGCAEHCECFCWHVPGRHLRLHWYSACPCMVNHGARTLSLSDRALTVTPRTLEQNGYSARTTRPQHLTPRTRAGVCQDRSAEPKRLQTDLANFRNSSPEKEAKKEREKTEKIRENNHRITAHPARQVRIQAYR